MAKPSLRNIWAVIAYLESCPDDTHDGITNAELARRLRLVHEAYVQGPNKRKD
jgi:hypothetical protein